MKHFMKISVFSMLLSAGQVQAAAEEMFNANQQCKLRQTSTGDVYAPPCQFNARVKEADANHGYVNHSMVRAALFKTQLDYDFVCDSIRPLSVSYQLKAGEHAQSNGRIAGSKQSSNNHLELTHEFATASLTIDGLQGAAGFQAIKPGCRLVVTQLVSYPEPTYFNLLANNLASYNAQLQNLVRLTSTSIDYLQLITSIDNAVAVLEMLQFDNEDELLLAMLVASIDQLKQSKQTLSNQCGGGSQSSYCSAEIGRLRDALASSISSNESNIRHLIAYLENQIAWLNNHTIGRDLLVLRQAYSRLKTLL